MNKIHLALAAACVALSAQAFAQEDTARQQRMDDAYADSHHEARATDTGVRDDLHRAGHSIHNGVRETGHAIHHGVRATGHVIHQGVRATGHAIHHGVRATGHAIHRGVDKVTGR